MNTLLGGKEITVTLEVGTYETVTVRQIPVRDYDKAFRFADNEIELHALIIGKSNDYILSLTPESYEDVIQVAQEVNAGGFFKYCARQMLAMATKLNSFKPEVIRMAAEKASQPSAPGLLPR